MTFPFVVLFAVFAMALGTVTAVTDDERAAIRAASLPVVIICSTETGITKEDVLKAKETKNPESLDPCFYACFFKKSGIINQSGMYEPDVAVEKNKKYIHGEDDIKKIVEVATACTSVNKETVGDGTKGCERARLLVHCLLEHKSSFSPLA